MCQKPTLTCEQVQNIRGFCFGVIRHTDFAGWIVVEDNEKLAVAPPAYPGRSWLLRARRLLPSHLPKAAVARTGTSNGGTSKIAI